MLSALGQIHKDGVLNVRIKTVHKVVFTPAGGMVSKTFDPHILWNMAIIGRGRWKGTEDQ